MIVTNVELKLADREPPGSLVLAYAMILVDDCLCIRDLKLIDGPKGPFVQFPNKVRGGLCPSCGKRVEVLDRFCCRCGIPQPAPGARMPQEHRGRPYRNDICYPIRSGTRREIEDAVIGAYREKAGKGVTA
jgi:DNA-binding cell septation regulator SpoVG